MNLKKVLMERDNLTSEEAEKAIAEAAEELQARLANGEMPFDICDEFFGLEEDYLEDLI
jgi:U3 small nucleolar ribonucleoprotein component